MTLLALHLASLLPEGTETTAQQQHTLTMPPKAEPTDPAGYKNLVDLLAVHAEAVSRMDAMQGELNDKFLAQVDEVRPEYALLQQTISDTEEAIEALAIMNPAWFAKSKTVKTPYGSVSFRKGSKLVVKNPELTIVLIEQRGEEAKESYIRTTQELDLEALEKLPDDELKKLRITRETSETCTVKAAKVDLGKAVKKSPEKAAATA